MSVLIKGMKMPSGCISCDFCNPFTDKPYCRRLMRITPKVTRLKDCPLVEVPTPHGRLVDADALKATFCAECNHTITCEDCDIDYHIGRLAPTIIEAEEGEVHDA